MSQAENDRAFNRWQDSVVSICAAPSAEVGWHAGCRYMAERAENVASAYIAQVVAHRGYDAAINMSVTETAKAISKEIRKLVEE